MIPPFTSGPRLSEPPLGDPARQAYEVLRGYAYQLYVSALAWRELRAGEDLYLEIAEDYATVAGDALNAVQVKDTAGSGRVTLNSEDVLSTLDAFVDLIERNPNRQVRLRFLSTSAVGIERKKVDRIEGGAALDYWRRAAAGADVAPLRILLSRVRLTARVRAFVDARDDEVLRADFLRRVHWDCGQPGIDAVQAELDAGLVRYGIDRLRLSANESRRQSATVLHHLLTVITQSTRPRLQDTDLLTLLSEATRVSFSRGDVDDLIRTLSAHFAGGSPALVPTIAEARVMIRHRDETDSPGDRDRVDH